MKDEILLQQKKSRYVFMGIPKQKITTNVSLQGTPQQSGRNYSSGYVNKRSFINY